MISTNKIIVSLAFIDILMQVITRGVFSIYKLIVLGNLLHGFIAMFFFLGVWINFVRLIIANDIPRGQFRTPLLSVFSPYMELSSATKNIRMNIFKFLGATSLLIGYTAIFGMGSSA